MSHSAAQGRRYTRTRITFSADAVAMYVGAAISRRIVCGLHCSAVSTTALRQPGTLHAAETPKLRAMLPSSAAGSKM
jgi:hypothetical protein